MTIVKPCTNLKSNYSKSIKMSYETKHQKNILKNIKEALKEIEEGKGIPMENIVAEMEEKYHLYYLYEKWK